MSYLKYFKTLNKDDFSLDRVLRVIAFRIKDIPHKISWSLPLQFSIQNKNKIMAFRDIHKGERCFILANGPSLSNTNFDLLENEITIGMNRGYLLKQRYNFMPTYLVSVDIQNQLKQFRKEFDNVQIIRFYNWNARFLFSKQENIIFLRLNNKYKFEKDILNGIWYGHSVTFACIALAYYMGFQFVYLIGKDHLYKGTGRPKKKMISDGKEMNHFIDGYYKKGMRWDLPNFKAEEYAYKLAKEVFESDGRKIFDATKNGKLQIFEKVEFESLF